MMGTQSVSSPGKTFIDHGSSYQKEKIRISCEVWLGDGARMVIGRCTDDGLPLGEALWMVLYSSARELTETVS
jgi:hypothetical protein